MDSDNESIYSESEFYYPEEYGKEMDKRNIIVTQYDKTTRTWTKFRNLKEKRRPENKTKKIT